MRIIRWQNTGETGPLFVAQDADVGQYDQGLGFVTDADDDSNQPQLFEMDKEWSPLSASPRIVSVTFSPVDENDEDTILEGDDWWQNGGGGGGSGGGGDGGSGGN